MQDNHKFRTDLALEAADTGDGLLPKGVCVNETIQNNIICTTVKIETEEASQRLGRPIGQYLTFEGDFSACAPLIDVISEAIVRMIPEGPVLVAGLGNYAITPDSLGPGVANSIIATYHLPEKQLKEMGCEGIRKVCSISPGSMGQTGIESADMIAAIVRDMTFSAVIAVDALAARSLSRLGRTVQFSNTGIIPGGGVQNKRSELSFKKLGIPVFSLGIPTVVDAATVIEEFSDGAMPSSDASKMMVMPRDIDFIIDQGTTIVSTALNRALLPLLDDDSISILMN